jgi:hypothetical protein
VYVVSTAESEQAHTRTPPDLVRQIDIYSKILRECPDSSRVLLELPANNRYIRLAFIQYILCEISTRDRANRANY